MRIVLKKTSFVDYPGKPAAVFFFPGCNLRCPWCQNRELVAPMDSGVLPAGAVDIKEALAHIARRRDVLGAVVLSGGEASIYSDLPEIVRAIKKTGLPVKLDTNGINTKMLIRLFESKETRPDYVALDLKLAPRRYKEIAHDKGAAAELFSNPEENLIQSAALVASSGAAHEYRSLALPGGFFSTADVEALAPLVDDSPWYFRPFRPGNCLDPAWDNFGAPSPAAIQNLAERAKQLGKNVIVP